MAVRYIVFGLCFASGIAGAYFALWRWTCSMDHGWCGQFVSFASPRIGKVRKSIWRLVCRVDNGQTARLAKATWFWICYTDNGTFRQVVRIAPQYINRGRKFVFQLTWSILTMIH